MRPSGASVELAGRLARKLPHLLPTINEAPEAIGQLRGSADAHLDQRPADHRFHLGQPPGVLRIA